METWLLSGQLLDLIILLIALEAGALMMLRRRFDNIPPIKDLLPNLLSGAALMLALRFALTDAGWLPVSACLGCALLAHIADLQRRLSTDDRT
ncbi:MAG: hypothetical protein PVJ95_03820 [Cellvibrionales bacterium]|jgi:hypothetical protein